MEMHARVETERAGRYLTSLCHHFGRKVPVEMTETSGRIVLPFGQCNLQADNSALTLSVSAANAVALDRTREVIASHLERFAFRENPVIDWGARPDDAA